MALTTECPSCRRALRLPEEYAGRRVQCPECQHAFTAEGPGPAPVEPLPVRPRKVEEDDGDEDVRERVAKDVPVSPTAEGSDAWGSLALGCWPQLGANLLLAMAFLLLLLFVFAMMVDDRGRPGGAGRTVTVVGAMVISLALFLGWALDLVAGGFWATAPVRAGARALGIVCLLLSGLVLLRASGLLQFAEAFGGPGRERDMVAGMLAGVVLLYQARLVACGFFLWGLASALPVRRKPTGIALALALTTPAALAMMMLITFLTVLVSRGGPLTASFLALLNALGLVGILGWQGVVLLQVRGRLKRLAEEPE